MTDVKQSIAAKLGVVFVAVAMMFSFAVPAQAQTASELQDMINDLLAQIQQLEAQSGGSSSAGVCPQTWTRSLSMGDTGADVKLLQEYLNSNPDHRVAATGVGSAGMETEYFGALTAAAVSKFQVMYSSEVLSPVGLTAGTGYFGPSTRAKLNDLCSTATPGNGGSQGSGSTADLSGIGTLETFKIDDVSNNDVQEGESDAAVVEFEVEFQDGDARIDFMDIKITLSGAKPWDAFDDISLWVDGEEVAKEDISNEDDYLGDEDDNIVRVSGLDIVAMEDEPVTITVGVSAMNNVDSDERGTWDVSVEKMRYFDAAGVATTDSSTDEMGETASFDLEEAGEDEELKIRTSSNDPVSTTIVVDDNNDTNNVDIFKFDVEAEEGDIELNRLVVKAVTTSSSTDDVVKDAYLTIGGETFKAENISSTGGDDASTDVTDSKSIKSSDEMTVWYSFDIDGDVTIDDGDREEATFSVDFKSQTGNYPNGEMIQAMVDAGARNAWDAEGADDLDASSTDDISGSATGDQHILRTEGVAAEADTSNHSTDTQGQDDTTGIYKVVFDVTAFEDDFYITDNATTSTSVENGVVFSVDGGTATTSGVLASTAEETGGVFRVEQDQTETFTLTVTLDPAASGQFRVKLDEIWFTSNSNGTGSTEMHTPTPSEDFRTDYMNVNN